ncbi:CoA-transferase family III [Pholiota conissans]|uniref:CoA-transferase family III n=1 Tax=Pholiota conissans TaxID=109636 RepID=A0A9P6D4V3_9AGAR|nr:CoA-transferase family III [Pholiota conissans]
MTPLPEQLKTLWLSAGLPEDFLSNLSLVGNPDTAVPSSFRVGLAAQISISLLGLSSAYLHYLRTGVQQTVTVEARHAALSFHSEAWYTVDDALYGGEIWDNIAGLYRTQDGWVRIHTNFPHHRAGVLKILGLSDTPDSRVAKAEVIPAILKWDAQALEEECGKHGMCVFKLRTLDEWERTKQAAALVDAPVIDLRYVGDATIPTFGEKTPNMPMGGVRVLDLSRVLAGPVAGRSLAAYGAQVLLITSANLPSLPLLDIETSLGKRTTQLNLSNTNESNSDREKFRSLVQGADVFLQAYRPGGLDAKGFGVADVARIKSGYPNSPQQGFVYASLRAWGWDGPWADRRGFDSLVQTATGFNVDEGNAYHQFSKSQGAESEWAPRPLPMQALDHAAGYFLAFGINVALARALTTGRSHEVRVSLAAVGKWIRSLGRLDPETAFGSLARPFPKRSWPPADEIKDLSVIWNERRGAESMPITKSGRKKMTALRHAAILSKTPVREGLLDEQKERHWGAPMRLDVDAPVWI